MEKKKILLIGDSIRMGYDKYVKEALSSVADVYYPDENCRFAEYTLRYAHEWKEKLGCPNDLDVVHWNVGLWDVLELFGDEPLTTIDYYAYNVARIDKRLRMLFPNAKMIFATSTPIIEARYSDAFRRHNENIEKYNAAAIEALRGTDTVINDLYATMCRVDESYHSDATHFYTPAGTELIGGKVLAEITALAGIAASDVNIENFTPEKYTKENIGG